MGEHRFLYWAGSDRISWQKLKPLSRWNDRLRVDIETEISTGDRKRRDISFQRDKCRGRGRV